METGVFERKGSVFFPVGALDVTDSATHQHQLRSPSPEETKPEKKEKAKEQERSIPVITAPRYRANTETQYADTEVRENVWLMPQGRTWICGGLGPMDGGGPFLNVEGQVIKHAIKSNNIFICCV